MLGVGVCACRVFRFVVSSPSVEWSIGVMLGADRVECKGEY